MERCPPKEDVIKRASLFGPDPRHGWNEVWVGVCGSVCVCVSKTH